MPSSGSGWLTRERVIAYATILAIAEMALFAFCVAGSHGLIVPLDHQPSTDFVSFYAAGVLADDGTASLAYDHAAHHLAEQAAVGGSTAYNYFYYPPVFLLICGPLALLPYLPAFILFQTLSAAACFFSLRLIRRDLHPAVFLAFPGLWWAIGTGQNALLTAALFAAGTALLERRPWLSGMCFGALCYKPHFGLSDPGGSDRRRALASHSWRRRGGCDLDREFSCHLRGRRLDRVHRRGARLGRCLCRARDFHGRAYQSIWGNDGGGRAATDGVRHPGVGNAVGRHRCRHCLAISVEA